MTPREYFLLWGRVEAHSEEQRTLAGLLCATVANFSFRDIKEPYHPSDFVTLKKHKRDAADPDNPNSWPTDDELGRKMDAVFSGFGG